MEDQDKAPVDALKLHEFIEEVSDPGFAYSEVYQRHLIVIWPDSETGYSGNYYLSDMTPCEGASGKKLSKVIDEIRSCIDRWVMQLNFDFQNDFEMEINSNV